MKGLLVLLMAFFCWVQICSAQAYRPFLKDSAHWEITEWHCNGLCDAGIPPSASDCFTLSTFYFKLSGDTVIGSRTYKKLLQNLLSSELSGTNQPCFAASYNGNWPCGVVGLLWEDTIARKVFIRKTGYPTSQCWQSQDSLLFDFSKQVGDSISFQFSCFIRVDTPPIYIVTYIDTQIIYNQSVKTWHLQPTSTAVNYIYLYESIGPEIGFWGYSPAGEGIYSTRLNNYCVGSDSACGFTCDLILGITSTTSQQVSIAVYPNPARDILTLDISNIETNQDLKFVFTDILGQVVRAEIITKAKSELDISAFQPGIYLWHLLSGANTIRSGKLARD